MPVDQTDLQIISALQQNADQRLEDVAKKVKLATSSVHDRVRRLEREGVIRRWTIDVNAEALGLGVLAYIGVRSTKTCAEIMESLEKIREIEECHSVAGELCFLLKVRVPATGDLLGLIERVRKISGIDSTETTIVLQTRLDRPIWIEKAAKAADAQDK